MFIRYGNKYIEIKDELKALNLEVKFDFTDEGRMWTKLGDALHYFRDIEVDFTQFSFIMKFVETHLDSTSFSIVF
jgi:hypothetical protein